MYKKVLVPLDGSTLAECVLPHLEAMVKAGIVESVIFLRVVESFSAPDSLAAGEGLGLPDWQKLDKESRAGAENYLNRLESGLKYGKVGIKSEVIVGKAAETISDYAAANGVDLIALATHGRSGLSRWVWGSVADRILRSTAATVLIVRAPGAHPES